MQRWAVLRNLGPWILMFCLPSAAVAEEVEPLPVDFLEYLASFETDGDDWTLFDDEEAKKEAPAKAEERSGKPVTPAKPAEEEKP